MSMFLADLYPEREAQPFVKMLVHGYERKLRCSIADVADVGFYCHRELAVQCTRYPNAYS